MAKKSNAKRIEYLESVCMVAGFLLIKLSHSSSMGEGMRDQVHKCIQECNEVNRVAKHRKAGESNA